MTLQWKPEGSSGTIFSAPIQHPGNRRLFAKDHLTVGLILPLETHPDTPAPTMRHHIRMAQLAEESGIGALWMRDVPFFDPSYGDTGQVFEPLIYIATLSAATKSISLGTAGIVLPLREPKILAKQVTSLDHLSGGRMILGLSSGDRPAEYPLFDIDFDTRGDRFRDAYNVYRTVTDQDFPAFMSPRFGNSHGHVDLLPKPPFDRTPSIAIGRGQQSIEWIAENMDGFIAPSPAVENLGVFAGEWAKLVRSINGENTFKPIGIAGYLDLVEDRNHPLERIRAGFRTGSIALAEFLEAARLAGVSHAALNPKISRRPYDELLADLAENVIPSFPPILSEAS
ncbi:MULTISPECIES: TIGR03571 family LLM class oxidoreductase [Rhizobium/Agrobacterium group]|uniref:TIGR03571 family LLM class oxidoreductase n=1 Tax=Rhizobium/Agrobacterium group TaxID=227290 RepID=UPI001ADC281E|nr:MULTISPECIES: TIGR03571 family LLM class oxidoreductase [Rhizobium/Agrobacterium group]MBO9112470.1 TIGR03571 family LLM class oxidoreductase [Agrobacterium sp. S2/73]QXZ75979.1 TIGR03571 family LLM class oxidoreductase [Agrobacterium sp. S7/73]QYA17010.1 TIGR03571 family LLM class oxidoreductase [Rhizobium sp. AB2/73]UEQ85417.1 TIGR03571 family LLM class oxidoreductase [Rhizobium sp. AB2/73]